MSGKPPATIGSMHTCPMCTGTTPHVGGPITGPGVPTVLINGKPAAVIGDMCTCVGPPDTIVTGNSSVLVNGTPIACVGDMTAHGGTITVGEVGVIVGSGSSAPTAVMDIKKIPFPDITTKDRMIAKQAGHDLTEAENKQNEIKKLASEKSQGKPKIFNLKWEDEKQIVRSSKTVRVLTLKGNTANIDDGTSLNLKVNIPEFLDRKEESIALTGEVKDKIFTATWEIEDMEEDK